MRTLRVRRPAVVARVVGVHGVDLDPGEFGGQGEIELGFDIGDDELRFVRYDGQFEAVGGRVADDVDERQQLGHVHRGFARQLQVPEVLGLARFERFLRRDRSTLPSPEL